MIELFHYIAGNWPKILWLTWQHITIVGVAVGLAIITGIPLGVAADLGTGSLRVGAITAKGKVVATASTAIRAAEPVRGGSMIDAEAWWLALSRTVGRTLDQLKKGDHVRGVCLSGMTRSQVLLDREGRPLAPALLFRDRRAMDDAREVARHFATDNPADAITAFHPLARIAWFARHAAGSCSLASAPSSNRRTSSISASPARSPRTA